MSAEKIYFAKTHREFSLPHAFESPPDPKPTPLSS
jgi:hypothetical protein